MPVKFPCVCCQKPVKRKQKALLCTVCKKWVHTSCAGVALIQYDDENEVFENWQCPKCIFIELPYFGCEITGDILNYNPESVTVNNSMISDNNIPETIVESKGLKISHLNVRSLRNKKEEINLLLKKNPLSETWLDDSISTDMINIDDYLIERKDRGNHGGGVACYIKRNIAYVRKPEFEMDELELIWLEIKFKIKFHFSWE